MGGSHSYPSPVHSHGSTEHRPDGPDHPPDGPAHVPSGVVLTLGLVVGLIGLATAVGLVMLWPHGRPPATPISVSAYPGGTIDQAEVVSARAVTCPGLSEDRLPDGTIPPP